MFRKRPVLVAALLLGVVLLRWAADFQVKYLEATRLERESTFIAIHYLAAGAMREGENPRDIDELLEHWGGRGSALGRVFPEGLVFHSNGISFTLEEPHARRISLWRSDRLTATDRRWPRWKSAGGYARKFPDQEVPPEGYE